MIRDACEWVSISALCCFAVLLFNAPGSDAREVTPEECRSEAARGQIAREATWLLYHPLCNRRSGGCLPPLEFLPGCAQ